MLLKEQYSMIKKDDLFNECIKKKYIFLIHFNF